MLNQGFAVRRSRLAAGLPADVDAFLVTRLVDVRYLTGFTGSNGALLVHRDGRAVFATDGRYVTQASSEVPDLEAVECRTPAAALSSRALDAGARRLAVAREHVTVAGFHALQESLPGRLDVIAAADPVAPLRVVKDDDEIALLARACAITDSAYFAVVEGRLVAGVTERQVARAVETAMLDEGAEGLAFPSIVAFGPNSAVPHHQPTDRPLASGDLVKLDIGARYAGYHADMTRTVVLGSPADWQRELHALVTDVQRRCRACVVPGASPADLQSMAAALIEQAGHRLQHGLGHGVGLEVHEPPFLSPEAVAAGLVEAVPVTVEPGVYLPGRGGVRIEDTVVVRTGEAEPLTRSSRDLLEIG